MRVFYAGERRHHHMVMVAPAADPRGVAGGVSKDWLDADGEPRTMAVNFIDGAAVVADDLGRYLVAAKLARRTPLIIPPGVAA